MKPIAFNLRVDVVVGSNVHCSLYVSEVFCGKLILGVEEYKAISLAVLKGSKYPDCNLADLSDDHVYMQWMEQQGK